MGRGGAAIGRRAGFAGAPADDPGPEGRSAALGDNGDVRLRDVRGSVVLETHLGDLEVGIHEGTAAWVDVRASAGRVRNELEAGDAPASSAERLEVRARTAAGDVLIRRP